LKWLLPLAGSVGWLLSSDERNMRERVHTNALARDRSAAVSNVGVGALAGVPAVLYWWGWRHAYDYAQRTAILSARAAADALIVGGIIHGVTWRERPMDAAGSGRFFAAHGLSSSFPSLHSGAAWAIASVVARRYPGWLTQVGVYGLAGAVSVSRITSREHYPSDVVVGSALGWLIGRYVSRPESFQEPRAAWEPAPSSPEAAQPETGAVYLPMDSWIYAALDRLAALGLIPSQISGLRPWTRAECRRQVLEADEKLQKSELGAEAADLVAALRRELGSPGPAAPSITLQSLYLRNGGIAGPALEERMPVLTTLGVRQFIGIGRTPSSVPDSEIDAVRAIAASWLAAQPWPFLRVGHRVRLRGGSLDGVEGILVAARKRHRLIVSVELLQRSVAVEVDQAWVEAITPHAPPGNRSK
jgi:membrane-associated phospholipid phosphatase